MPARPRGGRPPKQAPSPAEVVLDMLPDTTSTSRSRPHGNGATPTAAAAPADGQAGFAYGAQPAGNAIAQDDEQRRHVAQVAAQARAAELSQDPDELERIAAGDEATIVRVITGAPLGSAPEVRWRTLADIPDAPPRELLLGMLEPDGPTLAYGAPGVGKGTTASWVTVELQRQGMKVAIYDAERRPREWARRVAGLGGDRSRVVYIDPTDLGRAFAGKPLWDAEPALRALVRAAGVDLLIVDSILPATGVGEERLRSDAQAPYLFVGALDALAVPSLTLGHTPKGQPEGDPYGSQSWLGAMRLTWLGTSAEGDGHRIRWRPRKRNERGHLGGILLDVAYGDDGRPCEVTRSDDDETSRDWLLGALAGGPRSVSDLAEALVDEMDAAPPGELERARERLSRTLRRMKREGWVELLGKRGSRNATWTLRERTS